MPASFSPWTTSCAFAISMSLLSFALRSSIDHSTNSQFCVDFFLQTKIKQPRHRKRFLQLLSLRISFEILTSILLGNHAVSSKTLLGKQIGLPRRILVDLQDFRDRVDGNLRVFMKLPVGLGTRHHQRSYRLGLCLERFLGRSDAVLNRGIFFQNACQDVHLKAIARDDNGGRRERSPLYRVARQRL